MTATVIWLCGYLFGLFGAHPPTKESDAATWAGAFGTFLAFGGTVWLATNETRRRERSELVAAQLLAASMVLRLAHAASALTKASRKIDEAGKVDVGLGQFSDAALEMESIDLWTPVDLTQLAAIPTLAVRLAESGDQIKTAIIILRQFPAKPAANDGPRRMEFARKLYPNLAATQKVVNACSDECRHAANALQIHSFR